jgi:hypothetical protein
VGCASWQGRGPAFWVAGAVVTGVIVSLSVHGAHQFGARTLSLLPTGACQASPSSPVFLSFSRPNRLEGTSLGEAPGRVAARILSLFRPIPHLIDRRHHYCLGQLGNDQGTVEQVVRAIDPAIQRAIRASNQILHITAALQPPLRALSKLP